MLSVVTTAISKLGVVPAAQKVQGIPDCTLQVRMLAGVCLQS